jgi:hypothetical protein
VTLSRRLRERPWETESARAEISSDVGDNHLKMLIFPRENNVQVVRDNFGFCNRWVWMWFDPGIREAAAPAPENGGQIVG